jgi:DNA modification methylase
MAKPKTSAASGDNGPQIEVWAIDRVKPYDKNPRTLPQKAIDKVAASLKEFGFQKPIVVDEHGVIIAGHVMWKAAQAAGITRVPVAISSLTPAQAKAYRLADNRTAQETDWLDDLLKMELIDLKGMDFDLGFTGFDDRELFKLLSDDAELERAEETPPVPEIPVTVLGDVWILGNHRLICGDSTSADVVSKLLGSVKPHLMVTDPPYGVEYDAEFRNGIKRKDGSIVGARAVGKVLNDDCADWREAWALFPGDVAYVWHASLYTTVVAESLKACGLELRAHIVWAKNQIAIGRGHYHWQHEPCWYVVRAKPGATGHWQGARDQSTLWKIDKPQKSETGHSTQKPIECMRRPITNNSSPGQAVYEPFSGSGTTLIAAEMTGRHCYAIELSPQYVDVGVIRWEQFTNQTAIHEETGQTFAEMKANRTGETNGSQEEVTNKGKRARSAKHASA